MSSAARQFLNALKRAPVAVPVYVAGMVSGLAAALAPDRDIRRAASRSRFIAGWKRRVRKSIEAEGGGEALEGEAVIGRVSDAAGDDGQLVQLREALLGLPKALVATLLGNPASSFYVEPTDGA